ncbi:MAG: ATP-binding protein, partial [Nitratireductor sp.]
DLPALFADEQQIRRILVNLVSNAVKFTPPQGTISVVAEVAGDGGMRIAVHDTGIGIPADKLQKVLEPFEQVENSFTRTRAGTGLGLPLAKAMAEAHDGVLCLESEIGMGTTVCVCLPPARLAPPAPDRQMTEVA